jgi:hypothetical protein
MWFSIIKNKLLIKPKTQLRVQDNPTVDDDEPCKEKLKEYMEYMEFMKNNYKASEDKKLLKLLVGLGEIIFRKGTGLALVSYATWNEGEIRQNYLNVVATEQFEQIPEKVACKALDMLESDKYNVEVNIDRYAINHTWFYETYIDTFYAGNMIQIKYDGNVIFNIGKIINLERINNSKGMTSKFNRADLKDFMDRVKVKNWRI